MTTEEREVGWGTISELKFIAGLGTHSEANKMSRRELLSEYFYACPLRVNWGSINSTTVKAAVAKELNGD